MKFNIGDKPGLFYRRQKNSRGEEDDTVKLVSDILDAMRELREDRDEL